MQMGSLVCLHSGLEFNIFMLMKHAILLYNFSLWLHFDTNGPMTQGIIYYNNDGKICFAQLVQNNLSWFIASWSSQKVGWGLRHFP